MMSERAEIRTPRATWLACGAALGLALGAAPLLARPKPLPDTLGAPSVDVAPAQQNIVPTQPPISLQEAIQIATSRYPGRVVRAETTTQNGRAVHEIRILGTDNRVRTVRIDAQSGDPH
jgi:hypothetical protein